MLIDTNSSENLEKDLEAGAIFAIAEKLRFDLLEILQKKFLK
jgi:hypothetical protein